MEITQNKIREATINSQIFEACICTVFEKLCKEDWENEFF